MSYLPARSITRRLFAAAAAAAVGAIASAACAASSSPAAHAAPVIPACTGTTSLGAWIAVSQGSEASGTTYYPLEFTNTGGYTCSLSGYPVVSAISRAGVRLGSPAGRGLPTTCPPAARARPRAPGGPRAWCPRTHDTRLPWPTGQHRGRLRTRGHGLRIARLPGGPEARHVCRVRLPTLLARRAH